MNNLTGSGGSAKTTPQERLPLQTAWPDARHGMDTWAADLVDQYRALGLNSAEATRFFRSGYTALGTVLKGIDHHALAAAPIPEQVSILLPRFDIARLAATSGVDTAQAQSAVAMLVLEFVMHAHSPF